MPTFHIKPQSHDRIARWMPEDAAHPGLTAAAPEAGPTVKDNALIPEIKR